MAIWPAWRGDTVWGKRALSSTLVAPFAAGTRGGRHLIIIFTFVHKSVTRIRFTSSAVSHSIPLSHYIIRINNCIKICHCALAVPFNSISSWFLCARAHTQLQENEFNLIVQVSIEWTAFLHFLLIHSVFVALDPALLRRLLCVY